LLGVAVASSTPTALHATVGDWVVGILKNALKAITLMQLIDFFTAAFGGRSGPSVVIMTKNGNFNYLKVPKMCAVYTRYRTHMYPKMCTVIQLDNPLIWFKLLTCEFRSFDTANGRCLLFVCSIFILLSRESGGGAIFWTNPHSLRSCPFPSFPDFLPLNLLLVRSH